MNIVKVKIWLTEETAMKLAKQGIEIKTDLLSEVHYTRGVLSLAGEDTLEEKLLFIRTNASRNLPVMLFDKTGKRVLNEHSKYFAFWFPAKRLEITSIEESIFEGEAEKKAKFIVFEDDKGNNHKAINYLEIALKKGDMAIIKDSTAKTIFTAKVKDLVDEGKVESRYILVGKDLETPKEEVKPKEEPKSNVRDDLINALISLVDYLKGGN